jgi:hypothetical protein
MTRGKPWLPGYAQAGDVEDGVRRQVELETLAVYGGEALQLHLAQQGVAALGVCNGAALLHCKPALATLSRDFFTLFFIEQLLLVLLDMSRKDLEVFRIFEK